MLCRELITLQFGHYANFVGTHFWNIQTSTYTELGKRPNLEREINFDVTYREGKTLSNEITYTPRLILFDLKGSLNTLKEDGSLYNIKQKIQKINTFEDGQVYTTVAIPKNKFLTQLDKLDAASKSSTSISLSSTAVAQSSFKQEDKDYDLNEYDMDDDVHVWSDYLLPHLHPKTIHLVNEYQHDNICERFDLFGLGSELYKKHNSQIEDKLHFFAEECDSLQGFQIFLDSTESFSGFSSQLYEDILSEDFSNKPIILYNVIPHKKKTIHNLVNIMLTYDTFNENSNISILPLSTDPYLSYNFNDTQTNQIALPLINYNKGSNYHTSAILATGVNNLSLPFRCFKESISIGQLMHDLVYSHRNIFSLQLSLPFISESPLFDLTTPQNNANNKNSPNWLNLTPNLTNHSIDGKLLAHFIKASLIQDRLSKRLANNVVISGLNSKQVFGKSKRSLQMNEEDIIDAYLDQKFKANHSTIRSFKSSMPLQLPYPPIFSKTFDESGHITSNERSYPKICPAATSLECGIEGGKHLKCLYDQIEKIPFNKLISFQENGLEKDELTNKIENLLLKIENYSDSSIDLY